MVEIKSENQVAVAKIMGELDHHTAREIREIIDRTLNKAVIKLLVLDFSNVTFMDSSGIGLIMGRYKLISQMGGEVVIACPPAFIRKVLQISGISKIAKIVYDYSEIINQYQDKSEENKGKEVSKIEVKNN